MTIRIKSFVQQSFVRILALLLMAGIQAASQEFPTVISTVAGGIPQSRPALESSLRPDGITLDAAGNLYIADALNDVIRKIDSSGTMSVVAGNRIFGYSGDGGPALSASFFAPSAVAVDSAGNIFVADRQNNRIRKIDQATQRVTTIAGRGFCTFSGDGLPATSADICDPTGVALDNGDNLFIADRANNRVRKVDHSTQIISTVAGTGNFGLLGDGGLATSASLGGPGDVALDGSGNLFIADTQHNIVRRVDHATQIITTVAGNTISGFSGDGGLAISGSLSFPQRIVIGTSGTLFIADAFNSRIRRVDFQGLITTVAGNGIRGFAGDGGPAVNASLNSPSGLAIDSGGNLLIADNGTNRIRIVDTTGMIHTIAGNGETGFAGDNGPATEALLLEPTDAVADDAGNLFIADRMNNRIRKVDTKGVITTIAGNGQAAFSGDGGPAVNASLNLPFGLAVDHNGNLFVSDEANNRVRKIDPQGIITTVAGNGVGFIFTGVGDGGPAVNAILSNPTGLALDSAGNLFITEFNRVRMVTPSGVITTVAGNGSNGFSGDGGPAVNARLNMPLSLAFDKAGNLIFSDSVNNRIRRIDPAGIITTVAGGVAGFAGDGAPAINAQLSDPAGIAIDGAGNLLIADSFNQRIRKVDSAGIITTIVGNGTPALSGDGGPALLASLNFPASVTVDAAGNLFIADSNNNRIRKIISLPLGKDQFVGTVQDQSVSITLTGASPRGSVPLTFSIVQAPGHGVLSGFVPATGAVIYTPAAGYFGDDQFTFKVNDGNADSPAGVVSLGVQGLPDFLLIQPSPTIRAGKSIAFNFTALAQNGFNSPISFACSDLPPFSTCSFSPTTTTPNSTGVPVTVRIQTNRGDGSGGDGTLAGSQDLSSAGTSTLTDSGKTPPGTYVVTVTASSADGAMTHVMQLVFTVID